MKSNRKKKMEKIHPTNEEEKEKEKASDQGLVKKTEEPAQIEEPNIITVVDNQINDNMSMMCPICHFFMYKSVCATCGHMFCQYCLDEYLIFKDSCPLCEKSIRRGKITRWCVADSAIEKMLTFSTEEYLKEWDAKKKYEDDFYAQKKIDESILVNFQK